MKPLKSISTTWEVQETQNGNVAVPKNPWDDTPCHLCNQNSDSPRSCVCEKFEHADYEIKALPTVFTNLSPGTYKAKDLGEVVWQGLYGTLWLSIDKSTYERYLISDKTGYQMTAVRLFLPSPTNLTNK